MDNLPLFDASQDPIDVRLRTLFVDWVAHRANSSSPSRADRPLKEESVKVYQEMWHAFSVWCDRQGTDLEHLRADHIRNFIASRCAAVAATSQTKRQTGTWLSPRYVWRMLTLIDRITRFDARRKGITPNPAARDLLELPEYRYANASHKDPVPEYYDAGQTERLIAFLTGAEEESGNVQRTTWKELRDRTIIAVMLGGGLTPGDVRAATLDGIATDAGIPWKMRLPGNGNSPSRETPLASWAGEQLARWLKVRATRQIAGNYVFPSTLSGKPLSHTSCYEACKAVLAEAGFPDENGGVFKLRHTFALRQLASGKDEAEVARWLGFLDINSMEKYRRVVVQPADVV